MTAYERFRFRRPEERHCAHWSHSALVVGANGAIIEAGTKGVVLQHIGKYDEVDYHYVAIEATPTDRSRAVRFATSRLGRTYSRSAIARLAASILTAGKIGPRASDEDLCGGLVAAALGRAGESFDKPAGLMLPADLAKHYGVRIRRAETQRSTTRGAGPTGPTGLY